MTASVAQRPHYSAVLPVYNEQTNLEELHRRLTSVFGELGRPYELLFIDDGSADRSYQILSELAERDPRVRVLKFSRNFGHHMAITCGLDHAEGEVVILMDSDLQDLPEEIPALQSKLEQGFDMVYGIRKNKQFSLGKRLTSSAFRWLMGRVFSYELSGGIFRAIRRPMVEQVRRCRETDRLVDGLIAWTGFRQTGVEVSHGARQGGETSYTLRKQIQLALNALTAFSTLPLKLASWFGFLISGLSFLWILWIVARRAIWGLGVEGWSSLIVLVSFLGGVQLLCIGVLGEYVGRIFTETRQRPLYVIEQDLRSVTATGSAPSDGAEQQQAAMTAAKPSASEGKVPG